MNANKWAPKLVIILQLATWTIVGLVLLQRGASSLRRPVTRASHAVRTQVGSSERISKLSNGHGVDFREDRREDGSPENLNVGKWSRESLFAGNSKKGLRAIREGHGTPVDTYRPVTAAETGFTGGHQRNESVTIDEPTGTENDTLFKVEARKGIGPLDGSGARKQNRNGEVGSTGRSGTAASGAAAAAAVAMLVIGVVMLVLGPAIVILRALEGRRRARRATKSRTRKDLPPSYEQATLMDQAPRYSTLHLNASFDCSLMPNSSFALASTSGSHSQSQS